MSESRIWPHDALPAYAHEQLPPVAAALAAKRPDVWFMPPGPHPNNNGTVGFMVIVKNAVFCGDVRIDQDEAAFEADFNALLASLA